MGNENKQLGMPGHLQLQNEDNITYSVAVTTDLMRSEPKRKDLFAYLSVCSIMVGKAW